MRARAPHLLVVLIVLIVTLQAHAAPPTVPPPPARVTALNVRFDARAVHLTVDLYDAAAALWQVYYAPDEGAVIIDMRNVDASAARAPRISSDPLARGSELRLPTFLSAQWAVKLGYAIPTSNVRASLKGATLTVDIDRAFTEEQTLPLTRNTSWRREEARTSDEYALINELDVAIAPDVRFGVAHANDSLTTVEDPVAMAKRKGALALINGGFFQAKGGPLGLVIDQGRLLVPHVARRPPRTAVGFTATGDVLMNRVEVKDNLPRAIDGASDWSRVLWALGGGPRLVRDGRVALTTDEEALGKSGNDITRKAGRTAVGRLRNGHLLFVTISGYEDNHSQGWQLPRLAAWFIARGATDAMCLDGGGSVAMVLDGVLVSRPPMGSSWQRKVANGLMVTDASPSLLPATVQVTAASHRVKADGTTPVKVVAAVTTGTGQPVPDGTMVYFSTSRGVITAEARTRGGRATATFVPLRSPGPSTVVAYAGLVAGQDEIAVEAGPPKRMAARVSVTQPAAVPTPPPTDGPGPLPTPIVAAGRVASLEVLVLDAFENALPEQDIDVACGDGPATRVRTGADGVARVSLPLGPDATTVRVTGSALAPLDVPVP